MTVLRLIDLNINIYKHFEDKNLGSMADNNNINLIGELGSVNPEQTRGISEDSNNAVNKPK